MELTRCVQSSSPSRAGILKKSQSILSCNTRFSARLNEPRLSAEIDWSKAENGVLIAGAGIAGLGTAAALHKVGIPSLIVERDPGPRREGSAIALWTNAFRALDALGVAAPLRDAHPLLQRVEIYKPEGVVLRNFHIEECSGGPHEFRGVLRSSLLEALESCIPEGSIAYGSSISKVENSDQGPLVTLESGRTVRTRALVGADGTRSTVAASLNLPLPNYAGYSAYRGVAEFSGPLPIPADTVRQVLGPGPRAGLYALSPTSTYWFVTVPGPPTPAPSPEHFREDALRLVRGWASGIVEAVENTPVENIKRNRIVDRWLLPTKTFGSGCVTLAGDAVHPMTPNLGQGGCTALEDAIVLAQSLREAAAASGRPFQDLPGEAVSTALREYERRRVLRVTKITVRSNLMGLALGSQIPPVRPLHHCEICMCSKVVAARDLVIRSGAFIGSFMNHTMYDCGQL